MLIFQPENIPYVNKEGESILTSALNAGIFCENICGGRGTCGKCRVKVEIGEFNPVTKEEKNFFTDEELETGYRLACCLYPKYWFKTCEIMVVDVEEEKKEFILEVEGERIEFFRKKSKELGWNLKNDDMRRFGMAVDIGTTNIEALFWNLGEGDCVARILQPNPQQKYGADVVSRIAYAIENKDNFTELCEVLRNAVKNIADIFLKEMDYDESKCIVEKVVIAGNSTMMHFWEREDVSGFVKAPYHSLYKEGRCKEDNILSLKGTKFLLLPNIESFVGADTVGVLVYLNKVYQVKKTDYKNLNILIIDIGTNGELILQAKGQSFVSSTSAGPAFEGASMLYGMRAELGAITGIELREKGFKLKVIGDLRPKGICGSGFIEIIAKFYEIGLIDKTGYLLTKEEAIARGVSQYLVEQLRKSEYGTAFELYSDNEGKVLLTQKDIRELQLAKAAIVAGVNTMLIKCNLKPEDVDKCYLAGAFGTYLDKRCAKLIGLLPDIAIENIIPIGNGALLGATHVLMESDGFELANKIAMESIHISLSDEIRFREEYIKGMDFGKKVI